MSSNASSARAKRSQPVIDVIVVGLGIAGGCAAVEAAAAGASVIVIERAAVAGWDRARWQAVISI